MLTAGEGLNFLGRFLQDASVIEVYHFKSDVFEFFAGLASFIFKAGNLVLTTGLKTLISHRKG